MEKKESNANVKDVGNFCYDQGQVVDSVGYAGFSTNDYTSIGQSLSNFNYTTDKSLATYSKMMEFEDRGNNSKQNLEFANGINVNIAELSQTVGNYLNSVGLGGFLLSSEKDEQRKYESASTVEQVLSTEISKRVIY